MLVICFCRVFLIFVCGRAAVEESERGDDGGAAASVRQVAVAPCRIGVPGELLNRSRLILSIIMTP